MRLTITFSKGRKYLGVEIFIVTSAGILSDLPHSLEIR
jgi:hypothetical protein